MAVRLGESRERQRIGGDGRDGDRIRLCFHSDLPFPIALISGHGGDATRNRGSTTEKYGIRGFPSTILIDREGKVVGKFQAHEAKSAISLMEKLLKDEKK